MVARGALVGMIGKGQVRRRRKDAGGKSSEPGRGSVTSLPADQRRGAD
jgi:hypothetical protein